MTNQTFLNPVTAIEREKKEKLNRKKKKKTPKQKSVLDIKRSLACKKVTASQDHIDNTPNAKRDNLELFTDKELSNDN